MPPVLAFGAWLKNAACLLADGRAQWSPVHGDLGDPEACRALDASVHQLAAQSPRRVAALAHDLHPDFFSTRLAQQLAEAWGLPAVAVQHHHAHIGVVMADHGIEEPVVGLALDGVGLGTDGTAWGGELLWVAPGEWRRMGGLWPLQLPGGDVAAREPWRMAAAALQALGRGSEIEARFGPVVGTTAARGVQRMLAAGLNCPVTSSTGRWFDAAAGALALSVRQAHEAEAAIALEKQAVQYLVSADVRPRDGLVDAQALQHLDLRPLLPRLFDAAGPGVAEAAAWFHVSLARALADWAAAAARETAARAVCLGGGCFFNQVLTSHVVERLAAHGLRVLVPRSTNCGDAGLALGQAWVAARQLATETVPCA
ncbi:carbamoyltransferase HypF [Roseateles saccharophilus]|uniref:Hydrogenase maturation protein HypF n=1 Tax=Roseateles saccharophilus TaxID=304 RepID=A0A4R3USU6_ROSSA|nr:carbamoyltransferase HypF [Roseateles saccharophilus]MDG0833326.1 carbamoyltransferase HypF [Roseateles saccharophilus]TCU93777.1 hydrogenase maturation protein HypF [Roseateles saccharophilus]